MTDEVKFSYDGWGKLITYEQDNDSVVGEGVSPNDFETSYTYAKSTLGRNSVRRMGMTYPDGTVVAFGYSGTSHEWELSRVTTVRITSGTPITVAYYRYEGLSRLVRTEYLEPDVYTKTDSDTVRDRFNRTTGSVWLKKTPSLYFYNCDITWDRNSNITLVEDNIFTPVDNTNDGGVDFDVEYTIDNLNRLTKAEEGEWNGSSITNRERQQIWTLDQQGSWDIAKWDENGDNDFTDTGEYNDDRTYNVVNELTGRDTDDDGTDDFTLSCDANGNITDDGEDYEYEYDAFGRLRKVSDTTDQSLVAEYTYNGLGHRIAVHEDQDADGDVDVNDEWFHFAYNERWQTLAVYHEDDQVSDPDDPKERFICHNAGLDGMGGESYIDNVLLRDRDDNTAWTTASDGTREQRLYYCHNWRNDICSLITDDGKMKEWIKYDSYGRPYGIPVADTNGDGTVDATDSTNINTDWWTDTDKVTGDTDLDGSIDADDATMVAAQDGTTLGWDALSHLGNRKGYGGYEFDDGLIGAKPVAHGRARVYVRDQWLQRDPLGFVDGPNLYQYGKSRPLLGVDPSGFLFTCREFGGDLAGICIALFSDPCFVYAASSGFSGGGRVVCSKGKMIACTFPWKFYDHDFDTPYTEGGKKGDEMVGACAKSHEEDHISAGLFSCDGVGDNEAAKPTNINAAPLEECERSSEERKCVVGKFDACNGDRDCEDRLYARVKVIERKMDTLRCDRFDLDPPTFPPDGDDQEGPIKPGVWK